MARKKSGKDAFAFLLNFMKKNPKAIYADAAAAAKRAGYTVYPISWGRAQLLLGRAKKKTKTTRKVAKRTTATRKAPATRRPRAASKASGESMAVPIEDSADFERWQSLVTSINDGGKAVLQFDGDAWTMSVR